MTSKTTPKTTGRIAARGPGGRIAKFEPTEEQRRLVMRLASVNCSLKEILYVIDWGRPEDAQIDEKTLRKYFDRELAKGLAMRSVRLKTKIHEMAESGNVACLIYLCKSQFGWSETVKVEQTGKDGAPLAGPILYLPAKDQQPETVEAATVDRSAPRQQAERFAVPTMSDLPPDPAGSDQVDPEHRHAFGSVRATTFYPAAADPLRKVGTR